MHAVLSPEFFLMWVIATWYEAQPYASQAQVTLRRALSWVVRRYLDGRLEP